MNLLLSEKILIAMYIEDVFNANDKINEVLKAKYFGVSQLDFIIAIRQLQKDNFITGFGKVARLTIAGKQHIEQYCDVKDKFSNSEKSKNIASYLKTNWPSYLTVIKDSIEIFKFISG